MTRMARRGLEDFRYEQIKQAILNPDKTPLTPQMQERLERTIAAAKLLDKNPSISNAVKLLRAKYPNISRSMAFEDCHSAMHIFNSYQSFNYEWWHYWLLKDIVEMITRAKEKDDLKAWAMGHKNLMQAIGERPEVEMDPKLIEKHTFNISVQINNKTVNIEYADFLKMPPEARKIITNALNEPIDDKKAIEIMNS